MKRIYLLILGLSCFNCLWGQEAEAKDDRSPIIITPLAGFGFGTHHETTGAVWRAGSGFFLRAGDHNQFGLLGAFIRYMPDEQNHDFALIGDSITHQSRP